MSTYRSILNVIHIKTAAPGTKTVSSVQKLITIICTSVLAQNPIYFLMEVRLASQGRATNCISGCLYI
jgi:hypothetical protein